MTTSVILAKNHSIFRMVFCYFAMMFCSKGRLVDFLLRFFWWSYITKAEGKSPKVHNFRRCSNPDCGKFVWKLTFKEKEARCKYCDTVLFERGYPSMCMLGSLPITSDDGECEKCENESTCAVGKYFDKQYKKRVFYLYKPLHNLTMSLWIVATVVAMMFLGATYRKVYIFDSFCNAGVDIFIWVCIIFNFWTLVINFIINLQRFLKMQSRFYLAKMMGLVHCFVLIATVCSLGLVTYANVTVIPIWREIPTEAQWNATQKKSLDTMQSGIEQFEVSMEIQNINKRQYFVEATKIDFAELMQVHSDFSRELDLYYGANFYVLVQEYLGSLDAEALSNQCCNDPWNIIYTPVSVGKFSKNIDMCFEYLP